jgi:hypothetical protein
MPTPRLQTDRCRVRLSCSIYRRQQLAVLQDGVLGVAGVGIPDDCEAPLDVYPVVEPVFAGKKLEHCTVGSLNFHVDVSQRGRRQSHRAEHDGKSGG